MFELVFLIVGLLCVYVVFQYAKNASAPRLSQEARVVSKRQHVSGGQASTSTSYYVTFEFADRRRGELGLSARDYGLLVEGDAGILHSQGDWFKGFDRR